MLESTPFRVNNRSLSTDEITNSHAELYFHLKKLDQNKINLQLCKYIKENNNFRIVLQRQFVDKLTKNAYIKSLTKRQCATIKQAFFKNYDDIDDNYNSVPRQKLKLKRRHRKRKLKRKKISVFYIHQQLQ